MKSLKTKQWASSVACLVGAMLLATSHAVVAQEVRFGGVTISIPRRTKTPKPEKPAPRVEPAADAPAANAGEAKPAPAPAPRSAPSASASPAQRDVWLEVILDEIAKRKKEVESYEPSYGRQLVKPSTPELFAPAISLRARERYYKTVEMNERRRAALNTALDALAAAAAKKLPQYKPDATVFAFRNQPAEQLMVRSMKNAATLKVHKSGLKEANWLIEKNAFGLPVDRYKHGFIWARDANDDHPYRHLYTIHVQQDYAGGGTYGQTFAKLSEDEIVGCP